MKLYSVHEIVSIKTSSSLENSQNWATDYSCGVEGWGKSYRRYTFKDRCFCENVLDTESVAIQMKAAEQYFPVVLFIMLYKVALPFESVDEILKCENSNESYWAVLPCGAVYYGLEVGSNFWVCGWNPKVWPFNWKLLSSTSLWCCLLCCRRWF